MKLIGLFLLIVSGVVFATPSPWHPKQYKEVQSIKRNSNPTLRVEIDARSTTRATGYVAYAGESIPADSLVTDVKMYVDNIITSADGNTVSLGCESAADLMAAASYEQAIYATNYQVQGIPTGATANQVYSSDGCVPYITVGAGGGTGSSGLTDGRLIFFIKYLPVENQ